MEQFQFLMGENFPSPDRPIFWGGKVKKKITTKDPE